MTSQEGTEAGYKRLYALVIYYVSYLLSLSPQSSAALHTLLLKRENKIVKQYILFDNCHSCLRKASITSEQI